MESKIKLIMNNKEINSLGELRENFEPETILKHHLNGDLSKWLEQHYYDREASEIKSIPINQPNCLSKICKALSIKCDDTIHMSAEEKAIYEARKKKISEVVNNEKILANINLVALNQGELASLLDKKEKRIFLCKGSFSIPIRVSGTEYICIGGATIENPYTKSQYEKAGIRVIGYKLPEEENPDTIHLAKEAAISNGYDDFQENHTSLAIAFHKLMKSQKCINTYHVPYNSFIAGKAFTSKSECINARDNCIRKAYEDAEKRFSSSSTKSIAREAAEYYSKHISYAFENNTKKLETLCGIIGKTDEYLKLKEKIDNSHKALLREFNSELDDNRDYYNMYDFNYFIEQVDVEEHDYRVSDEFIFRAIETLFANNIEYTIHDLYNAIREIENDTDKYANTFFGTAFDIYKSYVAEIEKILDLIGSDLPEMSNDETVETYLTRCCIEKTA